MQGTHQNKCLGNIPVPDIGHASSDGSLAVHTAGAAVEPRVDVSVDDRTDGSKDDDIVSPATKRNLWGKAGVDPVPVDSG